MQFNKVKSMLKTKGRIIVDEDGDEIILRGVGTGSWMNPEGFLMGTMRFGADMGPFMRAHPFDRGRTMDPAIEELCGKEYAVEFREKWMRVNLAEEDLKCFRQLGFNSIRLALSARLFLEEGPGIVFNEKNFAYLDEIIDLCEQIGLYVILDMHAACGGQSGVSCDDGYSNVPTMFLNDEDQERTIILWQEFASRYRDRWIVAGYELLNEPIALPMWDHLIPVLKSFYDRCVQAIRKIDTEHIIFIQGNRFAGRYEIFDHDYDPECHNWVMAVHLYEKLPDLRHEEFFKTWLVRILINVCNKQLRYHSKHTELSEDILYESSDTSREVRDAIEKLPPKIRQTVVLYYIEDFSVKEIKQILKVPEGTVKSRLSKGRELLRIELV